MVSSQELYNICLKTSLFGDKLCYNDFKRVFLLWKTRNLGAWRISCTVKEAKATGTQFLSDFCCNKNILLCTFLLQISWNIWFLTFVLNLKNCFNAKKETFSSMYLLITEIYTYWIYGDSIALPRTWKATAARWKSMFYAHYNFHSQDYCGDWWQIWAWHLSGFMLTCQLQSVVVKWLLHWKCIAKFQSFIIFYSCSDRIIVCGILRASQQYKKFFCGIHNRWKL